MTFINRQEEAEFEQAQLESHSCVDPMECRICTEKRNNIICMDSQKRSIKVLNNRYEMLLELEVIYERLIDTERRSKELNIKTSYLDLYEERLITIQNEMNILGKSLAMVLNYDTK